LLIVRPLDADERWMTDVISVGSAFRSAEEAIGLLDNVLESSTEYSMIATDLDGTILLWNAGARLRYGYTPAEAVGQRKHLLHTPQDVEDGQPEQMMADALRLGKWEGTVTRVRQDGTTFPARVVLTRRDHAGEPLGFLLISKDITEELAVLEHLEAANAALETTRVAEEKAVALTEAVALVDNVLESSTEHSVVATDLDGTILLWNAGARLRYGYTAAEAVGQRKHMLHTAQDIAAGKPDQMMADALRLGKWEGTVTRVRKNGTTFPARVVLTRRDHAGEPLGFLLISKDITEELAVLEQLEAANAALERTMRDTEDRSRRDPLTGLLNHREFHEGVHRAVERAMRDGPGFSVVLLDVDGFKRVNDDYGHAEGDQLLGRLAAIMTRYARADDLVCRVGGDEFAILLPGSDATAAAVVGRRIQAATSALEAGVGISFGISDWATDGPVAETLLLRADVALYAAKPTGGSRSRSRSGIDIPREDADVFEHILAAAREQLNVDLVLLTEFADGKQVFKKLEGDATSFGVETDASLPLEQTYCQRMVSGRLPNLIVDAQADPRVRHLAMTKGADVGAYLGVPVELSDGSLYGTLCCVSHTAEPSLGERDVAYMHLLARLIADRLEDHARGTANQRQQSGEAAIAALLSALAARDHYTGSHSLDVVELARKVAHQLRLSDMQTADVEQVALLHDLGKIGIPDAILQKPGRLTPSEWQTMSQHPAIGAQIIASVSSLSHLAPPVRAEHERYDGHGYPDGLTGEQIPLASRIVFACDAYHAMISDRPYRRAMHQNNAIAELRANAGTQFDPDVTHALLRVLKRLNRQRPADTMAPPAHAQAALSSAERKP
jgi:diguanylate cyclase (GGDEF)-like protein/PAS domain S-box-containing protein